MNNNLDNGLGDLILINTGKNGNPTKRKETVDIQAMMDTDLIKSRAHAYCQPSFCGFYGGPEWNCDGTRREGVEIESIIWIQDRVEGTAIRRDDVLQG